MVYPALLAIVSGRLARGDQQFVGVHHQTEKINEREREREGEIKQQQIDLNLAPVLIFPTSTHRVDGSALNSSGFHQVLLGFLGFYSVAVG